MKKVISLSEYESLYEHLERSEAWIAIDARKACADDTRAIFLGEEWGKLKHYFDLEEYPDEYWVPLEAIWKNFFSEDLPSLSVRSYDWNTGSYDYDIDYAAVGTVIQKIAQRILDAVYEIEGDNE